MSTFSNWDDLDFWKSGEWQVIEEKLDDLKKAGQTVNPERKALFAALDATPFEKVKAVIIGQDPYPTSAFATGIAFSIPKEFKRFPPTLNMVFDEYESDLHYPRPKSGDLHLWCEQGVLLWNAIPTCTAGKSLSHKNWFEWDFLTQEIFRRLSGRGIVFCFLGSIAGARASYVVDDSKSAIIKVSHPSPRGIMFSKNPFTGSRMFTTINDKLCELGTEPIDWRLE